MIINNNPEAIMSVESAKGFMVKVETDQEFTKQVSEKKSADERHEFVKAGGFDFTTEEINRLSDVISDEELDAVAGGARLCVNTDCGGAEYCPASRFG